MVEESCSLHHNPMVVCISGQITEQGWRWQEACQEGAGPEAHMLLSGVGVGRPGLRAPMIAGSTAGTGTEGGRREKVIGSRTAKERPGVGRAAVRVGPVSFGNAACENGTSTGTEYPWTKKKPASDGANPRPSIWGGPSRRATIRPLRTIPDRTGRNGRSGR